MGKGFIIAAGGNISKKQDEIYGAFLEKAGGKDAKIAIFVVSSEIPVESFASMQSALIKLGTKEENIQMVPMTFLPNLIGNGWAEDGNNANILKYLKDVTGIWFVGGDQMRSIKALMKDYKTDTLILSTIRDFYLKGGVIGGTSAGASILGNPMIGGGTDLGALTMPICFDEKEYEKKSLYNTGQMLLSRGFGMFEFGFIDQHFNTKPRLQRVLKAMETLNEHGAVGLDEDTAIIFNGETNECEVIGSGRVTVIIRENQDITITRHNNGEKFNL